MEQVAVLPADPGNTPGPQPGAGLVAAGARWKLPQDAARLLRVQARVSVVNLMNDRTIHLKVKGLQDPAKRADTEVLLVPAAKLFYFLTATFTLTQWIANWESHQAGKPSAKIAAGYVISGDDRDEGVVDTWPLRLAAWPIKPTEDSDSTWQLAMGIAGNDWF